MGKYRSLPYYGGKRGYGLAEWIAEHLPADDDIAYIEPFAGMAGVLLARPAVKIEILNDLNGRVVNWWRAVRDEPDAFGWLVENTPFSRAEFEWACASLDDESLTPLRRALAFHIAVDQGIMSSDGARSWRRCLSGNKGSRPRFDRAGITRLADRLRSVQLESVDALDLLKRTADYEACAVYADPPYPTADTSVYAVDRVDIDALAAAFQAQRGAVAVSGYGSEWDCLGWHKTTKAALRRNIKAGSSDPRTGDPMAQRQGGGNEAAAAIISERERRGGQK